MSETTNMLNETATKIFADLCTKPVLDGAETGVFPKTLWDAIESAGFASMLAADDHGGIAASPAEAVSLLGVAGRYSVPAPLAETMIARWLLSQVGLPARSGPLAIALGTAAERWRLGKSGKKWILSGKEAAVPWGASAQAVVVLAEHDGQTLVGVVEPSALRVDVRRNIAGEPRDGLTAEGVHVAEAARLERFDFDYVFRMAALFRAALMSGALQQLLDLSVTYVSHRIQFGRPLAKFQAVQQQLAVLAGSVAASSAITNAAAATVGRADGELMVAAARSRLADAIDTGNAIAHQVHGAMGFVREYDLHLSTRRLWAWRDEYGTAVHWRERLGRAFVGTPANELWSALTLVGARTEG